MKLRQDKKKGILVKSGITLYKITNFYYKKNQQLNTIMEIDVTSTSHSTKDSFNAIGFFKGLSTTQRLVYDFLKVKLIKLYFSW